VSMENARQIARYGWMPLTIYLVTLGTIVAVDLLTGVLVGIGLSMAKLLFKVTRLWVRVEHLENGRVDLYVEGAATFIRLPALAHALERIPAGSTVHLHIQRLIYIDHSCMDLLRSWEKQQSEFGTKLVVEWNELHKRFHAPMILTRAA
jgi:MFS superfamily sulfate permease-like transporter